MPTRLSYWSRSLRLQVVGITLVLSLLAILAIGIFLHNEITKRLLEAKQDVAYNTVVRAAEQVSSGLADADTDPTSMYQSVSRTWAALGNTAQGGGQGAGGFEPVIAFGDQPVGQYGDIPDDLRKTVSGGEISFEYVTILRADSANPDANSATVAQPALVIGAPADTAAAHLQVYLIFPLGFEQSTVAVVKNTLILGGSGLALVMTLIAGLVAAQVVRPIRRAATTAGKFAAGNLSERMPVKGSVEMTTLAVSFNGMADAIRAQITQLEAFGKLQRQFTSDVSHELRTPVTTVRMAADFLHDSRDELPPHLARSTELMVDELDRFESLLSDLLEISRYDAGMAELSAESIDVRSVVEQVVGSSRSIAAKAGVALITRVPAEPVMATVDNRRVERILRNLVNNAIDHAEGGPVEIELGADDEALAVAVTDHGVGLKPGEAGLVFNRFWRADPSRQRQTGGTGLGLAISLEDARLHGGWLQATGEPGHGARFRLTLPRTKGALLESSPLPMSADSEDEAGYPGADHPSSTPEPSRDPLGLFDTTGPIARTRSEVDK